MLGTPITDGQNCEHDECTSVTNLESFLKTDATVENAPKDDVTLQTHTGELDCHLDDMIENLASAYVVG